MTDLFITELDAVTTFNDTDLLVKETDPSGTPETNSMTVANFIAEYLKRTTYQISRTVASNNLTVAIKDSDGNDATAAKPLNFRVNGTIRQLTGALSVTVNAGTNVFNLGASELKALAQELFVYVGYRVSDTSLFVIISRISHAMTYADFSSTSTNEKYGAYSGAAPASTDAVINIGRVTVQNSGTASFNWSIPTANVIVNRPIYETSWLIYSPTFVGFSTVPSVFLYQYKLRYMDVILRIRQGAGAEVSNATNYTMTLPFTAVTVTNGAWQCTAQPIFDNGVITTTPGLVQLVSAGTTALIYKNTDTGSLWTAANAKRFGYFELTYPIALS